MTAGPPISVVHHAWPTSPARPLRDGEVHLWTVLVDQSPQSETLAPVLSADELARAGRFHFAGDRRRYVAAHAALRDVLARYLRCGPAELVFGAGAHGKPFLPAHALRFNLSHSGNVALIAVAEAHEVGIDVEWIRSDLDMNAIARQFFSPAEEEEVRAAAPADRQRIFYRIWTRKEALLKLSGQGLGGDPTPPQAAHLIELEPAPEYLAALAVERQPPRLSV